mgnify:CR=1 FL=1
MYERTSDNNISVKSVKAQENIEKNAQVDVSSSSFICKVYGYMAIALLITFAVAIGFGYGLLAFVNSAIAAEDIEGLGGALLFEIISIVVSSIGLLVCSIIISIRGIRMKRSITVPGILYTVFMGVLMSSIVVTALEGYENGFILFISAFALTAVAFAIMYFIGKAAKNLNWLGFLGIGLLVGSVLIGTVVALLMLIPGVSAVIEISLIWVLIAVIAIFYIAMLLLMTYDTWRIQKIAESGMQSNNMALFCAFIIYQDFVYLFLKILRILLIIFGKSKK